MTLTWNNISWNPSIDSTILPKVTVTIDILRRLFIGDSRILNGDLLLEFFDLQIRKWCNFLSYWFCNFFIIWRTNRWESPAPWDPLYKAYIVNSPLEKVRVFLWVFGMIFLLCVLVIVATALALLPLHTVRYIVLPSLFLLSLTSS